MKRILFLIFTLLFISTGTKADNYEEMAKAVREEVWGWDLPAFKNYTVPEQYDTCSVVVLARHNEINVAGKKKIRYDPFSLLAINAELSYTDIDRFMVKINDKKALEAYSEIGFQQLKKGYGYRVRNTFTSIVGARIIKPDGRIIEIDASRSVALLDEETDKKRKIAIPDLQVGDILDYFYYDESQMDNQDIPLVFIFSRAIPLLSYSIHCETGKGMVVESRTYNGAPDFASSRDPETNHLLLDLQLSDLKPCYDEIWTNIVRNVPLIRMQIIHTANKKITRPKRAENEPDLIKNPSFQQVVNDTKWSASLEARGSLHNGYGTLFFSKKIKTLTEQYKSDHPDASPDEISAFIFYACRHYTCRYYSTASPFAFKQKLAPRMSSNHIQLNNREYIVELERYLYYLNKEANCALGFVATKDGASLEEIFTRFDTDFALIKSGDPQKTLACSSPFTHAWYIPANYEGEKAAAFLVENYGNHLRWEIKAKNQDTVRLPESSWSENKSRFDMTVSVDPSFSSLTIDRNVCTTGHFRETLQPFLLLTEDCLAEERRYLGIKKTIWEEMQEDKKLRKLIPDYEAAFEQARKKQKDYFKKEVEDFHDGKLKELIEYEVINSGIFHEKPDFIFRSKYTQDGLLKKAGDNYILDAGLLIGDQLHPNEQQRNRQLDIYMPFARGFEYNITVQIPEGYRIENAGNLNKEVKNSCGQFSSEASMNGNELKIRVKKIFERAYVPVEKWAELMDILDAAVDFTGQTVLIDQK
jgi:hypothetical protein